MLLRGSQTYKKKDVEKLKALHCISLKTVFTKVFIFFSLFKCLVVADPKRINAPTSKKYVTAKANSFQMH